MLAKPLCRGLLPIPIGTQIAPTRYDICDGYIDEEDRPEVVKQWHRIKTDYEPVTFRGVDFEYLAMMEECGAGNSVGLSPVTSKSDFVKIMQHPKLVLAHDWVALAHETGVHTSEEHLRQLVKHCWQTHVADEVLKAHGLPDLMNRIRVRATATTPAASWFRFSVPEFSAGSGPLPAEQGGQVETGSALAEGLAEDALGVMEGADAVSDGVPHDVTVQQQQGAAALPAVQPDEVAVQQGGQVETGSTLAEGLFEDALDGMEGEDAVAVGLDGSQANDDGNGASDGVPHDVTVQQQDEAVPVEQPAKKRRKYGKKCIHCGELIKRNELHFHASQALPADHRNASCARAKRRRAHK